MAHQSPPVDKKNTANSAAQPALAEARPAHEAFVDLEPELRRLAQNWIRKERANHTLQPTALVNEAYLRLFSGRRNPWGDRNHFLADASRTMRRILVDYGRKHQSRKRSGERVSLDCCNLGVNAISVDVIQIHDLLNQLETIAPRQAQLVELRFFGGCSLEEAAAIVGISPRMADKDWLLTRAWLKNRLTATSESQNVSA